MNDPIKLLVSSLAAPVRILLMAAFLLLAKMGWFTWLTPENYHERVNLLMDFLVVAVPAGYAVWAGFKAWREKQPVAVISAAASLPEVAKIVTTPEIAAKVDDPATVVTRG